MFMLAVRNTLAMLVKFSVALAITSNKKVTSKDILYIAAASALTSVMFIGIVYLDAASVTGIGWHFYWLDIVSIGSVFLFVWKRRKTSLTTAAFSYMFVETAALLFRILVTPTVWALMNLMDTTDIPTLNLTYNTLIVLSHVFFRKALFATFTYAMRTTLFKSFLFLTWIVIFLFSSRINSVVLFTYFQTDMATWWAAISLIASMLLLVIYGSYKMANERVKNKEKESLMWSFYATEMERQYNEIRSFKHDHANLMLSFKHLIDNADVEALSRFYYENTTDLTTGSITDSAVKDMVKLQIPELKSLLLSKIQLANVPVVYESRDVVTSVPMDTVHFLRVVGIFLDNAMEAVEALGDGVVRFGFHVEPSGIRFICQNPCEKDMLPFSALKARGFSTKGTGRGIGLATLEDILGRYEHVFLETTIHDGVFTQDLYMEL